MSYSQGAGDAKSAQSRLDAPRLENWRLAYILFCLGALALASPWLSGFYTIPWDARAQAYPQIVFLAKALASGDSPFWAPGVFAGHPQIADPQSLMFSPPFLLLALLNSAPGFVAVDSVVFLMLTIAGLALMALFRDHAWRPEGALVAAFAFSFGGSNAWRLQHIGEVLSLCWFVVALFFLSRALTRCSRLYGLMAGITAGFMVLGRDQIACLCAYLLALFVLWELGGAYFFFRLRGALRPLFAGVIGGLTVTLVPLAFTIALAAQSNRPAIDFASAARGSLAPLSLLTAVVSNLYGVDGPMAEFWGPPSSMVWGDNDFVLARNMGAVYFGAVPLCALLGVGLARGKLLRPEINFYVVGALLTLFYALGSYTPFFRWAFHVPGVDLFRRPADATFPLCALLAILAGYCVHAAMWHAPSQAPGAPPPLRVQGVPLRWTSLPLVAMAFGACVFVAWDHGRLVQATMPLAVAAISLCVAFAALFVARRYCRSHPALVTAMLALVMVGDLAVSNRPNESTALPPDVYDVLRPGTSNQTIALIRKKLAETAAPDRRDRVELAAVGYEWPNAGLVHGFDHDLGFNPVRLKLFVDATGAGDQIAIPEQRRFSPLYAGFRSPLADLLGVRLVLSGVPLEQMDKSYRQGDLTFVTRTKDAYVFENPRALPRVLFAGQARKADFNAMLRAGNWPDIDFRRTVLLEEDDGTAPRGPGEARIASYANTEVVVETDSPHGGYVVLNDVFHPWWVADIDGAPAPILRANVMFRAVVAPSGKHRVTFRFEPFGGLWAQTLVEARARARSIALPSFKIWGQ